MSRPAYRLVIDTTTPRGVVALGRGAAPVAQRMAGPAERPGGTTLRQLDELLREAGLAPAAVEAIGVGTGPGSFTGSRVGLAAAKTMARILDVPLVGIGTDRALRRAAAAVLAGAHEVAVAMPAGHHDQFLCLPGEAPVLVPPATRLADAAGGWPIIAIGVRPDALEGCHGPAGLDPLEAGAAALVALGPALLVLLDEDLAAGIASDVAALVPAYVARPRGLRQPGAGTWSPELR